MIYHEYTVFGPYLRKDRGHTGYFCSKRCIGLYGKQVQLTGDLLPEQNNIIPEKYCNKMA